jgi:hypothetical protein
MTAKQKRQQDVIRQRAFYTATSRSLSLGDSMTISDQINKLLATAQDLAARSDSDPDLAERLLAAPSETVAAEAGCDLPAGVTISAARDASGKLEMTASIGQEFEGVLDDSLLERISAGREIFREDGLHRVTMRAQM